MSREKAQALLTYHFGPFGPLRFPFVQMGKLDSLHLFGDTELMLLALYWHNRDRWKQALDIGANLGLHSICMAKIGWTVRAYEPDFEHFQRLQENLDRNHVRRQVTKGLPVRLQGPSQVSLFAYDNDTYVVHSFLDRMGSVELVANGRDASLVDLMTGAALPGQARGEETVFTAFLPPH